MSDEDLRPSHLEPSQLGTREYWDNYYQGDLDQADDDEEPAELSELESWFDDVNAPTKVLEYLSSADFPLSPANGKGECSILDLGTGNGGMLFSLRVEGGFTGPMLGVDYSQQSIDLARRLAVQYLQQTTAGEDGQNVNSSVVEVSPVEFEKIDLIHDDLRQTSSLLNLPDTFDLVLDKGTFDAISLSSDTIEVAGSAKRIHELYPRKIIDLIATEGYFLLTSCNWTEEEVLNWFLRGDGMEGRLEVFAKIRYPVYSFGGQQGQGVVSICFKKTT